MHRISAGLLMYRQRGGVLEVLLGHPGGPYFRSKDVGIWAIPKGGVEEGEDLLTTAIREFTEETGQVPAGPYLALSPIRQKGGKVVHAWAFEGDCNPKAIVSQTFQMEWPPRSGKMVAFPEIDRAAFFTVEVARVKVMPAQLPLIEELEARLHASDPVNDESPEERKA